MARRTAREKLDLFLQRNNHWFMGRPIDKTGRANALSRSSASRTRAVAVETTERRSMSHLLRSEVGQRMPLMQRQDLEHRQRRTPGAP